MKAKVKFGVCQAALILTTFGLFIAGSSDHSSVLAEDQWNAEKMYPNDWPQLYQRDKNGEVPFPISGATRAGGLGQSYNRPVYQTDPTNNDGFAGDPVNPGFGTYINTVAITGTPSTGALFSMIPQVSGSGDNVGDVKWPYPMLVLEYKKNNQVLKRLTETSQKQAFLNNRNNATIDYYKDGQLNFTFDYSIKVPITGSMDEFVNSVRGSMKKTGMAFSLYFKLPDGYQNGKDTTNIRNSLVGNDSYFKLKFNESSYTYNSIYDYSEAIFTLNTGNSKALTAVDDHFLKFSMTPSTFLNLDGGRNDSGTMENFFMKNTAPFNSGGSVLMDKYKFFQRKMNAGFPIELFLRLNMNTMTANGDAFDTSNEQKLTKGRALPAWDNNSLFNAAVLTGNKVTMTDKGFYPTLDEISDKFKTATLTDKTTGETFDAISGASDSHEELITNIVGQGDTTVHKKGIARDSAEAKNVANWSKDQYNPDNIDVNGGNAFPTWNQYISLYDQKDVHNTQKDTAEKVKKISGADTTIAKNTLPGEYELNREVTINANENFVPMDYYRSVNYFTKVDTTDVTKANVSWTIGSGTDGTTGLKGPGTNSADLTDAVIPKGETRTFWYYGTDENGNVFSPAKLTVNRLNYDVPKVTGLSKLTLEPQSGETATQKDTTKIVDATTGDIITQTDTFVTTPLDVDHNLGGASQAFHVDLPNDLELVQPAGIESGFTYTDTTGNVKNATILKTTKGEKAIGYDLALPVDYMFKLSLSQVAFKYQYKVLSDQAKVLKVGQTTYQGRYQGKDVPTDENVAVTATSNPATIEINDLTVKLKKVPAEANFGDGMDPLMTQKYFAMEDQPLEISSNGHYEGAWTLTAKLNTPMSSLNGATASVAKNFPGILSYLTKNESGNPLPYTENRLLLNQAAQIYSGNELQPDNGNVAGTIYGEDKWSLAINPILQETTGQATTTNSGGIDETYLQPQIDTLYEAKVTWTLGFGPTS